MANYFTMEELTYSSTALRMGWRNKTTNEAEENLVSLRSMVLNPTREHMGIPIYVTSGFRSLDVNREIGGAPNSQHMKGEAADISTRSINKNKEMFLFIRDSLDFDQLILENGGEWIHVSYVTRRENRGEVLYITDGKVEWKGTAEGHRNREWRLGLRGEAAK